MQYQLTFAGVPFLLNSARVFRLPPSASQSTEAPADQTTVRKHQPEGDLIDELNRSLPFQYLQDFAPPAMAWQRNTNALANSFKSDHQPDTHVRIGDWYYPNNASRWSVFRGLATSSMVKAMQDAATVAVTTVTPSPNAIDQPLTQTTRTSAISGTFVMRAAPTNPNNPTGSSANYTVTTQMYMLPPRPLAEHDAKYDGLYLVTLVDERYYFQGTPVTLHLGKDTTWTSLIAQLANALGTTVSSESNIQAVYSQPEPDSQLWANGEGAAFLLDAVAANLGRTVTRPYVGAVSARYILKTSTESAATVAVNLEYLSKDRAAGGGLFTKGPKQGNLARSKASVAPANYVVTFPKYVRSDDPVPHFVNSRYTNQRPTAWFEDSYGDTWNKTVPISDGGTMTDGVAGVGTQLLHDTAKAIYDAEYVAMAGDDPVNVSDLSALALQIAKDRWGEQIAAALDESFPGTFKWDPEGIHDLIFTYSSRDRKALTRVMKTEWNAVTTEFQHAAPALANRTIVLPGVGGPSVAQSWVDSTGPSTFLAVTTHLASTMTVDAASASFGTAAFLPTQNRWKGLIENEKILFEGTGGIKTATVVLRGIDNTIPAEHAQGSVVTQLYPDTTYGVNLVRHEKMQFAYPQEVQSGGIAGVNVVPQTQSVFVLEDEGTERAGVVHYEAKVHVYDPQKLPPFQAAESVWVIDRNSMAEGAKPKGAWMTKPTKGIRYDGQLVGYSPANGAGVDVKPVYAITVDPMIFGQITECVAIDGKRAYSWKQKYRSSPATWDDMPEGILGDANKPENPAYEEQEGVTEHTDQGAVTIGAVVEMRRGYSTPATDSAPAYQEWVFNWRNEIVVVKVPKNAPTTGVIQDYRGGFTNRPNGDAIIVDLAALSTGSNAYELGRIVGHEDCKPIVAVELDANSSSSSAAACLCTSPVQIIAYDVLCENGDLNRYQISYKYIYDANCCLVLDTGGYTRIKIGRIGYCQDCSSFIVDAYKVKCIDNALWQFTVENYFILDKNCVVAVAATVKRPEKILCNVDCCSSSSSSSSSSCTVTECGYAIWTWVATSYGGAWAVLNQSDNHCTNGGISTPPAFDGVNDGDLVSMPCYCCGIVAYVCDIYNQWVVAVNLCNNNGTPGPPPEGACDAGAISIVGCCCPGSSSSSSSSTNCTYTIDCNSGASCYWCYRRDVIIGPDCGGTVESFSYGCTLNTFPGTTNGITAVGQTLCDPTDPDRAVLYTIISGPYPSGAVCLACCTANSSSSSSSSAAAGQDCFGCPAGSLPENMRVTAAGFGGTCEFGGLPQDGDCTLNNGTFTLFRVTSGGFNCVWQSLAYDACGVAGSQLGDWTLTGSGDPIILTCDTGAGIVTYQISKAQWLLDGCGSGVSHTLFKTDSTSSCTSPNSVIVTGL